MINWRVRLTFIGIVIVSLGVFAWSWTTATERDLSYTGYANISGPLLLEWTVTPAVSTPGEIVTLNVSLTNRTKVTHTPSVAFHLPPSLQLFTEQVLPAGVTVNMQTNELDWLPVVAANGGVQSLSLVLRVETADINQPEQVITAVLAGEDEEKSAEALVWIGIPPQINAVLARSQVAVGQPVQLTADVVGPGPISQQWDLGDGRHVAVNDPLIVYPAAGIYNIDLQATNPLASVSRQAAITVVPHPAAQFVVDDDNPGIDQAINFINQSGGQPPLTYAWDFGDGTTADSLNPSHQYTTPGLYQVHLTVQNGFGQSDAFWTVRVGDAPIADLMLDGSAAVGIPVQGQAFGDETITAYRWDMGDGRVYEGEQISHTYNRSGDFYVVLRASNEYGDVEIGRWLYVGPGQVRSYLPFIRRDDVATSQPVALEQLNDGSGLVLEPVELNEQFTVEPVDLPDNISPADELLFYINRTREQFALPPLALQPTLSAIAQQHVDDMALHRYTAHVGSDGSIPPERFLYFGYAHGYAGEATAWGYEHAYEAVEFWINSPGHRRILLNRYATDVGVAFTSDYSAPNVWYWTAEFGNVFAPPGTPDLGLLAPAPYVPPVEDERPIVEIVISEVMTYSWKWALPLAEGREQFVLYLHGDGHSEPLLTMPQTQNMTFYTAAVPAYPLVTIPGLYEWQVRLESLSGEVLAASERRPILFAADPNLIPDLTPVITATPNPTPIPTPTPVPWPTPTELPPVPTQPALPVATPIQQEP